MPKNFQDYLGNKVTFLKWEDNGLLLANFIEFFCRVLTQHYYNKFRKLIAKYSTDSKDRKAIAIYSPGLCDAFPSEILPAMMIACVGYPTVSLLLLDTELMKREWMRMWNNHHKSFRGKLLNEAWSLVL